MAMDYKTFPLTVTQDFLDRVERARKKSQSKHDFIVKAVEEKIENTILREKEEK